MTITSLNKDPHTLMPEQTLNTEGGDSRDQSENLKGIFEGLLQDIYWVEKYLLKILTILKDEAHHKDLKDAFRIHLTTTRKQVKRLERVFDLCGMERKAKESLAIAGIVQVIEDSIASHNTGYTRDAAFIVTLQRVKHYEMATYGTLKAQSTVMGLKEEGIILLEQTLKEEIQADAQMTDLAAVINTLAFTGGYANEEYLQVKKQLEVESLNNI